MKILVFGAGVSGCNLAQNLYKAGNDITILARGKWADNLEENGLTISYRYSLRKSVSKIKIIRELNEKDFYDIIFVVIRYSQIDNIIETISKNQSKNICFIGNNIRCIELQEKLNSKNVLFGYSSSSGFREEKTVFSLDFKTITIGQLKTSPSNQLLIKQIFNNSNYRIIYEPDMESWLLFHAAYVIPLSFACYHCNGNLFKIRWNSIYQNRIIDAIIEGFRAIKKSGGKIPESKKNFEKPIWRLENLFIFRTFFGFKLTKICISDYVMNARNEFAALNRDFKNFMIANSSSFDVWKSLESE